MACEEVASRATDYLDGVLPAPDRARFERHLEDCDDCRLYVAQLAQTINALATLGPDDPGPEAIDALLDAFRARVG